MRSRSTRSVIQKWYVTPPSQDACTPNFGFLPQCRRYASDALFYKLGRHSDPKMVGDTLPFQDASTHQIWDSYLK